MKFMKRIQLLVITLILVVTLAACTQDQVAPTITVDGDIEYTIGEDIPDYLNGAKVTDDVSELLDTNITVDSSTVDLTTAGTYEVVLTIKDEAGNEGTVKYNIIVSEYVRTAADNVKDDLEALILDIDALEFPTKGDNGSKISWSSSAPHIIQLDGEVKPHIGTTPIEVTITATATFGAEEDTKEFTFTVQPVDGVAVTSKRLLNFKGTSEEYVVADKTDIPVFYVDNGTIPYIDMETFVDMIEGAIDSSEITFTYDETAGTMTITYDSEWEDFDGTMVTDSFTAVVNFAENTFTVNNYGFFENYVSETESDYGEGLNYIDADYVEGHEVTIPLGEYNFDTLIYDDAGTKQYLMPLHIANLLFAGGVYYDVYYNGDTLYGLDTFTIGDGTSPLETQARTSSYNQLDLSADMRLASYNFMALTLDYFYGLKDDRGVDTYYSLLGAQEDVLLNGNDTDFYAAMNELTFNIDDLHTSHGFAGYYTSPYKEYEWDWDLLKPRVDRFYGHYSTIHWDLVDVWGDDLEFDDYTLKNGGRVAIVHLTSFTIDTPDWFKGVMDELPSTVRDVIIDLSYNTGGNIGAVMRIFGYMTEDTFQYHSKNPADGSASTYYIESDYVAYDFNWYVLISPVTFSAANMFASMAKESGVATVIGKMSSGGASSIGVIVTPDGTVMKISTNNVLCTRVGNETDGYTYISVEDGIEPDVPFSDVTDYDEVVSNMN